MQHNQIEIESNQVTFQGFYVTDSNEVELTDSEYIDFLDDTEPELELFGMTYSPGQALLEIDPVAFRVMKGDYESGLQSEYEDELESLIEEVQNHINALFESDTEQSSDSALAYFEYGLQGFFEYYTDRQFVECMQENLEDCELPEGITFEEFKDKALDLILENTEYYCNAKFTHSYHATKDCILGLPVGELEYQIDDYDLEQWPEFLIKELQSNQDFYIKHGTDLVYFNMLGIELILNDFDQLFNDVIESINDDKEGE